MGWDCNCFEGMSVNHCTTVKVLLLNIYIRTKSLRIFVYHLDEMTQGPRVVDMTSNDHVITRSIARAAKLLRHRPLFPSPSFNKRHKRSGKLLPNLPMQGRQALFLSWPCIILFH